MIFYQIISEIELITNNLGKRNVHTNVYGVARTIIALGTFLTLTFNETATLFPLSIIKNYKSLTIIDNINFLTYFLLLM